MAQTEKSGRCHECGGVTVLETRLDTVEYKGQTAAVRVKGHWCLKCAEAVLEGAALIKREQAFLALRAKVARARQIVRRAKRMASSFRFS